MVTIVFYALLILLIPVAVVGALWLCMFRNEVKSVMLARACRRRAFVCRRCPECCSKLVVLSDAEVAEICAATGLAESEFVEMKLNFPCLRRTAEGRCVFLDVDQDEAGKMVASCRVYAARPAVCRRYPHQKYLWLAGPDPRCRAARNHFKQDDGRK